MCLTINNEVKLFGTDGIRGRVGSFPITPRDIFFIAKSFAKFLEFEEQIVHSVIIGTDTRESCLILEQAFLAGLKEMGITSVHIGCCPTPVVAYLSKINNFSGGCMISASHNHYYDNGVKLFNKAGKKLNRLAEKKIEKYFFQENKASLIPVIERSVINYDDKYHSDYSRYLLSNINLGKLSQKFRVVIDCANGAAYSIAPKIFKILGFDLITINAAPNGKNINKNCGSLHPEKLCAEVLKYSADVGFAFDGDADRLICVDNKGKVIKGDEILALVALYLL